MAQQALGIVGRAAMARILVVDWEEQERVQAWSVLEEQGHELIFARDGKTALEIWRKKDVSLVITELWLPEMNGLRLIRELRELDPALPIIAFSAVSADQLDLAQDLGASVVLLKPLEAGPLSTAVEAALSQEHPKRRDFWR